MKGWGDGGGGEGGGGVGGYFAIEHSMVPKPFTFKMCLAEKCFDENNFCLHEDKHYYFQLAETLHFPSF